MAGVLGTKHVIKTFLEQKPEDTRFSNFQDIYGAWSDKTWPHSDRESVTSHFREESVEFAGGFRDLADEPQTNERFFVEPSHDPEEAADCLLLLLNHAHKEGYNLFEEALKKALVNMDRDWDVNDEGGHGHSKHR